MRAGAGTVYDRVQKFTKKGQLVRTQIKVCPAFLQRIYPEEQLGHKWLLKDLKSISRVRYSPQIPADSPGSASPPQADSQSSLQPADSFKSPRGKFVAAARAVAFTAAAAKAAQTEKMELPQSVAEKQGLLMLFSNGRRLCLFFNADDDGEKQLNQLLDEMRRNAQQYLRMELPLQDATPGEAARILSGKGILPASTEKELIAQEQLSFNTIVRKTSNSAAVKVLLTNEGICTCACEGPSKGTILTFRKYENIHSLVRVADNANELIIEYDNDVSFACRSEQRDELLLSICEMYERRRILPCVRSTLTPRGTHIGSLDFRNLDFEEVVLKRLSEQMAADNPAHWTPLLQAFVDNFHPHRNQRPKTSDKKQVSNVVLLLRRMIDKDVEQKRSSRSSIDALEAQKLFHRMSLALQTLCRLLTLKDVNQQVSSDYSFLFYFLQLNDPMVSFFAGQALRLCMDCTFARKSEKQDQDNRVALLGAFDVPSQSQSGSHHSISIASIPAQLFEVLQLRHNQPEQALSVYSILCILDVLMCPAGMSATTKPLFAELFRLLFFHSDCIFTAMYQWHSLGIAHLAARLGQVLVNNCLDEKLKEARADGLRRAWVLRLLHSLLRYPDRQYLAVCSEVLGQLCEPSINSMAVLSRCLPRPFLRFLESSAYDAGKALLIAAPRKLVPCTGKRLDNVKMHPPSIKYDWASFVFQLHADHRNAQVIWNESLRKELRTAIEEDLRIFDASREQTDSQIVVWNFMEFEVEYESIKDEPKVGNYYINFLLDHQGNEGLGKDDGILDPARFAEDLHHTLMFSKDNKLRVWCLQASKNLYALHRREIGQRFPFLHHLVMLLQREHDGGLLKELLSFLAQLLVDDESVAELLVLDGINTCVKLLVSALYSKKEEFDGTSSTPPSPASPTGPVSLSSLIAEQCLNVLLRLSTFHPSIDEQDRHKVPMPRSKELLLQRPLLDDLVSILALQDQHPALALKTLKILLQFVPVHCDMLKQVYQTGLFYLLFLQSESEFEDVALFLKQTHDTQEVSTEEQFTGGENDMSPAFKSILHGLLPRELIHRLTVDSSWKIGRVLRAEEDVLTPYVYWTKSMLQHLRSQLQQHLSSFVERAKKDPSARFIFSPVQIEYEELAETFVVYRTYMAQFVNLDSWPSDFIIEHPREFLEAIGQVMATRLLSSPRSQKLDVRIAQCLEAQLLLFKFAGSGARFDQYNETLAQTLVKCLDDIDLKDEALLCRTRLSLRLVSGLLPASNENVELLLDQDLTSRLVQLLHQCMSLLDASKTRSQQDRSASYNESQETAVAKALELAQKLQDASHREEDGHDHVAAAAARVTEDYHASYLQNLDEHVIELISMLLQILLKLAKIVGDAEVAKRLSTQPVVASSLTAVLRLPLAQEHLLVEQALRLLCIVSMQSLLQEKALQAGTMLHVIPFILAQDNHGQEFALLASRTLRKLAGLDDQVPRFERGSKAVQRLFTSNLYDILDDDEDKEFLKEVLVDHLSAYFIWNDRTRQELKNLCEEICLISASNYPDADVSEQILSFEYELHREELKAQKAYVRAFVAQKFLVTQAFDFVFELFQLLDREYELFEQEGIDASNKFRLERLELLLRSITHCLQVYDAPKETLRAYNRSFPVLVSLLRSDVAFSKICYHTMLIFQIAFQRQDEGLLQDLLATEVVQRIRDILFEQLRVYLPGTVDEVQRNGVLINNLLTVFYTLCQNVGKIALASLLLNNGLVLFLVTLYAGCFAERDSSIRKRCALILAQLMQDQELGKKFQDLFLPALLCDLLRANPVGSIAYFDAARHEYPEFIWTTEMKKLLTDSLSHELTSFMNRVSTEGSQAKWNEHEDFWMDYSPMYPKSVGGVYVSIYKENHESYPLSNRQDFIYEILTEFCSTRDLDDAAELLHCVLAAAGGMVYWTQEGVDGLANHVSTLVPLLIDARGEPIRSIARALFVKMSFSAQCRTALAEVTCLDQCLTEVMGTNEQQSNPDFIFESILRLVLYSDAFVDSFCKLNEDSSLPMIAGKVVEMLQDTTTDSSVQVKLSHIMRALCDRNQEISAAMQHEFDSLYEQFVKSAVLPPAELLLTTPIAPPMIGSAKHLYMGMTMMDKALNNKTTVLLFERLEEETETGFAQNMARLNALKQQDKDGNTSARNSMVPTPPSPLPIVKPMSPVVHEDRPPLPVIPAEAEAAADDAEPPRQIRLSNAFSLK